MAILTGTFGDDNVGGTLASDLILALSGNDTVVGGAGADTIDGGAGDDILYAGASSNVDDGEDDMVSGGDGNDTIYGAVGDNLNGNLGIDTLYLNLASAEEGVTADFRPMTLGLDLGLGDLLRIDLPLLTGTLGGFEIVKEVKGSAFADEITIANVNRIGATLNGGNGDDVLTTNIGEDVLLGDNGDDRLNGGGGRDILDGGVGNDVLFGGRSQDTLTGGSGKDVFRFGEGHTGTGRNTADIITDFSQRDGDRIALGGIDADARSENVDDKFAFIGAAKFSGTAGELRFSHVDGATFVQGDTNGDGAVDFTIRLEGTIELTSADFQL